MAEGAADLSDIAENGVAQDGNPVVFLASDGQALQDNVEYEAEEIPDDEGPALREVPLTVEGDASDDRTEDQVAEIGDEEFEPQELPLDDEEFDGHHELGDLEESPAPEVIKVPEPGIPKAFLAQEDIPKEDGEAPTEDHHEKLPSEHHSEEEAKVNHVDDVMASANPEQQEVGEINVDTNASIDTGKHDDLPVPESDTPPAPGTADEASINHVPEEPSVPDDRKQPSHDDTEQHVGEDAATADVVEEPTPKVQPDVTPSPPKEELPDELHKADAADNESGQCDQPLDAGTKPDPASTQEAKGDTATDLDQNSIPEEPRHDTADERSAFTAHKEALAPLYQEPTKTIQEAPVIQAEEQPPEEPTPAPIIEAPARQQDLIAELESHAKRVQERKEKSLSPIRFAPDVVIREPARPSVHASTYSSWAPKSDRPIMNGYLGYSWTVIKPERKYQRLSEHTRGHTAPVVTDYVREFRDRVGTGQFSRTLWSSQKLLDQSRARSREREVARVQRNVVGGRFGSPVANRGVRASSVPPGLLENRAAPEKATSFSSFMGYLDRKTPDLRKSISLTKAHHAMSLRPGETYDRMHHILSSYDHRPLQVNPYVSHIREQRFDPGRYAAPKSIGTKAYYRPISFPSSSSLARTFSLGVFQPPTHNNFATGRTTLGYHANMKPVERGRGLYRNGTINHISNKFDDFNNFIHSPNYITGQTRLSHLEEKLTMQPIYNHLGFRSHSVKNRIW